jgi:hypothetical protein
MRTRGGALARSKLRHSKSKRPTIAWFERGCELDLTGKPAAKTRLYSAALGKTGDFQRFLTISGEFAAVFGLLFRFCRF